MLIRGSDERNNNTRTKCWLECRTNETTIHERNADSTVGRTKQQYTNGMRIGLSLWLKPTVRHSIVNGFASFKVSALRMALGLASAFFLSASVYYYIALPVSSPAYDAVLWMILVLIISTATRRRKQQSTGSTKLVMWGGGKQGRSTTSSSSTPTGQPAGQGTISRPEVQVWLPEGFVAMIGDVTAAEADVEIREGIGVNCVDALQNQTSIRGPMDLRDNCRMIGEELVPQRMRQFAVTLQDGITPDRLRWILERLAAELNLLDDTEWTENAAALLSLPPYCNGCDTFGHTQEQCGHFGGRAGWARTERGVAPHASHAHGTHRLRKLGLNRQFTYSRVPWSTDSFHVCLGHERIHWCVSA